MTLELRCGDVVTGCEGVVHGATQEEVLARASEHAADAHDLTEIGPETRDALVAAIHEASTA